jgi:hypothetical protein
MEQFLYGFGGAVAALLLAVVWRARFGAPWVFGMCAVVGSFSAGWLIGRENVSGWPMLIAGLLAGGGIYALAIWLELEFKSIEKQSSRQAQKRQRKPKNNPAK